ncbi:hypothetical protein SS50377_22033 [Spironucleus salmonicida]|uniref:Uncharacterized protein n=1 Tax=Spironucleus salmonicida TaxID=348837 RepID=V6LM85_9EUKA|nr:hypothetical protein SS50377_22033 [Spironucleus salmonicida]|eukprot:EST45802.1 hypothetical protein SS50377_14376 [Spironucleus salmonicida]
MNKTVKINVPVNLVQFSRQQPRQVIQQVDINVKPYNLSMTNPMLVLKSSIGYISCNGFLEYQIVELVGYFPKTKEVLVIEKLKDQICLTKLSVSFVFQYSNKLTDQQLPEIQFPRIKVDKEYFIQRTNVYDTNITSNEIIDFSNPITKISNSTYLQNVCYKSSLLQLDKLVSPKNPLYKLLKLEIIQLFEYSLTTIMQSFKGPDVVYFDEQIQYSFYGFEDINYGIKCAQQQQKMDQKLIIPKVIDYQVSPISDYMWQINPKCKRLCLQQDCCQSILLDISQLQIISDEKQQKYQQAKVDLQKQQCFQPWFLTIQSVVITLKTVYDQLVIDTLQNKFPYYLEQIYVNNISLIQQLTESKLQIYILKVNRNILENYQLMRDLYKNDNINSQITSYLKQNNSNKRFIFAILQVLLDFQNSYISTCRLQFAIKGMENMSFKKSIRLFDYLIQDYLIYVHEKLFFQLQQHFFNTIKVKEYVNEYDIILPQLSEYKDSSTQFQEAIKLAYQDEQHNPDSFKNQITQISRKLLCLGSILNNFGYQSLPDVQYLKFPFQFKIELKICENTQQIISMPDLLDPVNLYKQYVLDILENLSSIKVTYQNADFLEIFDNFLQNDGLMPYFTEREQFIQNISQNLIGYVYQSDFLPDLGEYFEQFGSVLSMTTDIVIQIFNIDEEMDIINQFKDSSSVQMFVQATDTLKLQNQSLYGSINNAQDINLDDIYIVNILKDNSQYSFPFVDVQILHKIINYDLLVKKILLNILKQSRYYYCILIDSNSIYDYFTKTYQNFISNLNEYFTELVIQYIEALIDNMRCLYYAILKIQTTPQLFYLGIQLDNIFSIQNSNKVYTMLIDYSQRCSIQIINEFGYDGYQQKEDISTSYDLVQKFYEKFLFLQKLELYVSQRLLQDDVTVSDELSQFQHYDRVQLQNHIQNSYDVYLQEIESVHLTKFDSIELLHQAFYSLVIQAQNSIICILKRVSAYQSFQLSLSKSLIQQLAANNIFIENILFSKFKIILENLTLDSQYLFQVQQYILDIKERKNTSIYEREYIFEFFKQTQLELTTQQFNLEETFTWNIKKPKITKNQLLNNKILQYMYVKDSEQYYKINTLTKYWTSFNLIYDNIKEIMILEEIKKRWDKYLNNKQNTDAPNLILNNIGLLLKFLSPVYNILNTFFKTKITHDLLSEQGFVNQYPINSMIQLIRQYSKCIIIFKQQFREFYDYMRKNSISVDSTFLFVIDNLTSLITDSFFEVIIFDILKSKKMLPRDISSIGKQFDIFLDTDLYLQNSKIIQIYQKQSIQFFDACIDVSIQMNLNDTVFRSLLNIYQYISLIKVEYNQHKSLKIGEFHYYTIDISNVGLTQYFQQSIMFIQSLLLLDSASIAPQIFIFARDMEALLMNSQILYQFLLRSQFLINDLLMVKQLGNIIELDLDSLEHDFIDQKYESILQKNQRANHYNLRQTQKLKQKQTYIDETKDYNLSSLQKSVQQFIQQQKDKIQQQLTKRVEKFNILSETEQKVIIEAYKFHLNIRDKILLKDQRLIYIINFFKQQKVDSQKNPIKECVRILMDLENTQSRLFFKKFNFIFERFQKSQKTRLYNQTLFAVQTQYQIFDMGDEQKFNVNFNHQQVLQNLIGKTKQANQNYLNYKLSQSQLVVSQYNSQGVIIPKCNNQMFTASLLMDVSLSQYYSDFQNWNSLFLVDKQLKSLFFDNINHIEIQPSIIRGNICMWLESGHEKLMFQTPIQCPDALYKFPDLVLHQTNESVLYYVKFGIKLLESKLFQQFIKEIPYQFQIISFYIQQDIQILNQLKDFLKQNRVQNNIPIMCRLEEYINLKMAMKNQNMDIRIEDGLYIKSLYIQDQWLGKPYQLEYELQSLTQLTSYFQVIQSLHLKQTVILCQSSIQLLKDQTYLLQLQMFLSRLFARKFIDLYFTTVNFHQLTHKFINYIINGYIVYVHGLQLLENTQLSQIIELFGQVSSRQGSIPEVYQVDLNLHKVNEIVDKKISIIESKMNQKQLYIEDIDDQTLKLSQDDIVLSQSNFQNFSQQMGYFILIENIITDQDQSDIVQIDIPSFVTFDNQLNTVQYLKKFNNGQIINLIYSNDSSKFPLLNEFIAENSVFGNQFYQLSKILNSFDQKFPELLPQDIALIVKFAKNPNEPLNLCIILLDYLLRQYLNLKAKIKSKNKQNQISVGFPEYSENNIKTIAKLNKQNRNSIFVQDQQSINLSLLSNLISSIFELNKQQQSQLVSMSKGFTLILQKLQSNQRGKSVSFNKYFLTYVIPNYSQDSIGFINKFMLQNQISQSLSYEIFMLLSLLQFKKPILLQSMNLQYAKILINYLQNTYILSFKKIIIVTTYIEVQQILSKVQDTDILSIIPTSVSEFREISHFFYSQPIKSQIIMVLPIAEIIDQQTQKYIGFYSKRFITLPDFNDILGTHLYLFANKQFYYKEYQNSLFSNNIIFKSDQRYVFSTTGSQEGSQTRLVHLKLFRLSILSQIFKSFYSTIFDQLISLFSLGQNMEEFMVLRSCTDFFLIRFGILQPHSTLKSNKEQLAKNDQNLTQTELESISQVFSQNISVELKKKTDHQSQEMKNSLNTLSRLYQVNFTQNTSDITGFNNHDLLMAMKEIQEQSQEVLKPNIMNIIRSIQNNTENQGIGSQGSLTLDFNVQFLNQIYLGQQSTYESFLQLLQPLLLSLWNAFSLVSQFSQKQIVVSKRYNDFNEYYQNFDLEKIKFTNYQLFQYKTPLNIILYEHMQKIHSLEFLDLKSKYSQQQLIVKQLFQAAIAFLPRRFPAKQFSYISYTNISDDSIYQFIVYNFSKGILQNIDLHKFISVQAFKKATNFRNSSQRDINEDYIIKNNVYDEFLKEDSSESAEQQENDNMLERITTLMQIVPKDMDNLIESENISLSNIINQSMKFNSLQFDNIKDLDSQFKKQFANSNFMQNSIDIQQIQQSMPLYFDDERIALSVMIACCMLTPITFAVIGNRFTGKSLLITVAKLIVRDLVQSHFTQINDYNSSGIVQLIQQTLSNNYQKIEYPFFQPLQQEEIYVDIDIKDQQQVPLIISQYYKNLLQKFEKKVLQDLQSNQLKFTELKDKLIDILRLSHFLEKSSPRSTLNKPENFTVQEEFSEIQQSQQFMTQKKFQVKKQIYYYVQSFAFPNLHFHSTHLINNEISDNFISLLRNHVVQQNIISSHILDVIQSEILTNKDSGPVQLSDTSILLELSEDIPQILNNCHFKLQIPSISIQFLRKYFKYLFVQKYTTMNDEWVSSFLNGMNLISGNLPEQMFKSFKFINQIVKEINILLPSYKNIVLQSKKFSQLDVNFTIEDAKREMRPDLWISLVGDYEKFGLQYDKQYQEIQFEQFLSTAVENATNNRKGNPTLLQTIIALNQDDIFKQLNIYSLIISLKTLNISSQKIINLLERFTSLNLLGYLSLDSLQKENSNIIDQDKIKIKLFHPWQNTQNHVQMYPTLLAVLTQSCVINENFSTSYQQVVKAFSNKFANKLFYRVPPMLIDHDLVQKKLSYKKIVSAFLQPVPSSTKIIYSFEQYLDKQNYRHIYLSGLQASGMCRQNPFFIAHIIQLYSQCSDYLDPYLLHSIYKIILQLIEMKNMNINILKTQIQTQIFQPYNYDGLTNFHGDDYLRNFKWMFSRLFQNYINDASKDLQSSREQLRKKSTISFNVSKHNQKKENSSTNEDIIVDEDLANQIDSHQSDDESAESVNQNIQMDFRGIQQSAIYCIKIPIFQLQLNTNGNSNSYNLFIQILSTVSQYNLMSADSFKSAFEQMNKSELELQEEDISDNASSYSKASKSSASSKASSVQSGNTAQQFDDDICSPQIAVGMKIQNLDINQYRFFNTLSGNRKVIIDINNLLQIIATTKAPVKKKTKSKIDKQATNDLVESLRSLMVELQANSNLSVDAIEYVLILQLFRFSILMALGIKPIFCFSPFAFTKQMYNPQSSQQSKVIGVTLNSWLSNKLPASKIHQGKLYSEFMFYQHNNQLGQRLTLYKENYTQETNKKNKHEDVSKRKLGDLINDINFPDLGEYSSKFCDEPFDIIIVCPRSLLLRQSSTDIPLLTSILQSLQQDTFMQHIFDHDEMSTILKMVSLHLNLQYELPIKDLVSLLAVTFSLVIIDDSPKCYSPQLEYGTNQLDEDNIINLNTVGNIIEQMVNAYDINHLRGIQYVTQKQTTELTLNKFNTIHFHPQNIIKLFQLSNCILPQNFTVLERFKIKYTHIQQITATMMVSIYKQIGYLSGKFQISFNEFTQISSVLINQIYSSVQDFFDNMNYLFIAYHFYESIAAPSQTKQQMVNIFDVSSESIKQQILQEQRNYTSNSQNMDYKYVQTVISNLGLNKNHEHLLNSKCATFDLHQQLYCSVQEAIQIRNYLFTLMEYLRSQYKFFEQQLYSAHIDGIIMACYLFFGQSELIDEDQIYETLKGGKFAKLSGYTSKLVQKINEVPIKQMQSKYDLFLILMSTLIQESSVFADVSNIGIPFVKYLSPADSPITEKVYSMKNPLIIAGCNINPNQIQNNYIATCSFDFPILLILDQLKLQFKQNDPDLVSLYNIAINVTVVGKTTFLLNQDLLIPAACLLELLKRSSAELDFTKVQQQVINGQENQHQSQMINDIKRRLIMIDLLLEPQKFNALLCRVLSITDYMILFANYGQNAVQDNCATLRKFLSLRSRRIIQKRQTIYIGQQSCVVNQALHRYKIIISYQVPIKLEEQFKISSLYTQEFIDQICIIGSIKQKVAESNSVDIMTQQIMKSVFSEKTTIRYYQEESRLLQAQSKYQIKKMSQLLNRYLFYNIIEQKSQDVHIQKLQQNLKDKETSLSKQQYEMQDTDFIDLINSYVCSPINIIQSGIRTSFTLNGSLQQFDEFSQMMIVLKQVIYIEYQKQQFIQKVQDRSKFNNKYQYRFTQTQKQYLPYQDNPISARCLTNQICQTIGLQYCKQAAIAINFVQQLFVGLADQFIQLECLIGSNLTIYICQKITDNKQQLLDKAKIINSQYITREKEIQGQVILSKEHPIEVALTLEKQLLNEFLIEIVLLTLLTLTTPLLDLQSGNSVYFLLNLIFFSLIQYDDCIEDDAIIQTYIKQCIQTLHSSLQDHLRLLVGSSLMQIFGKTSKFQSQQDFSQVQEINEIQQYFPSITHMSDVLADAWFRLSALSNNKIIEDLMPFFIKHHSSFVLFTQCKHLFGSIIIYYKKTQDTLLKKFLGKVDFSKRNQKIILKNENTEEEEEQEEEQYEEGGQYDNIDNDICKTDFLTILKGILYDAENDDKQIQQLSFKLCEPTTQGFYAVLLMCNIMQPQYVSDNIQIFQYLMTNYLTIQGQINRQTIIQNFYPNTENLITGIFKRGQFTYQTERARVMSKITQDFSPIYTSFLTFIDPYSVNWTINQQFTTQLISVSLFIICELLYSAVNDLQRYYQKIKLIMEKEEYDQSKHYQYLGQLGHTPDQIFVIFYDETIAIKQLITFIISVADLKILQNIPIRFSNKFQFEDMKDQIMITDADPMNGGTKLLNFLHSIMLQKQQVYTFEMILPLFILIPIQKCQKDAKELQEYRKSFQALLSIIEPSFAIIQKPQNLQDNFTLAITQVLQDHVEQIIQNGISIPKIEQLNIQFIKQIFVQVCISQLPNLQTFQTELQATQYRILYGQSINFHYDISRQLYDCKIIESLAKKFNSIVTLKDLLYIFVEILFKNQINAMNKGQRYESLEDSDSIIEISEGEEVQQNVQIVLDEDEEDVQPSNVFDIDNYDENCQIDDEEFDFNSSEGEVFEEEGEYQDIDFSEAKTSQQNDKLDFIIGEDSFYQNVLNQLVLYEGAVQGVRKLNVQEINDNTEKLLFCQRRIIRKKDYQQLRKQLIQSLTKDFGHYQKIDLTASVKEDVMLFLFPIISKIDKIFQTYTNPKIQEMRSLRTLFSSHVVQNLVAPQLFRLRDIDILPQLFDQFISNIKTKIHSSYVQTKTFSPKILFSDLIENSINQELNIILGGRQFGIFEHEWILNTCVFTDILPEIFIFIKFRNAIVTGGSLIKQRIILLLEKLEKIPSVSEAGEINLYPLEGKQPFIILFRELEMIGATYDLHLQSFVDKNQETQIGYRQLFDVYCYGLTIIGNDLKIPDGYIEIPIKVNNRIVDYVMVRNKTQISKEEFLLRNICLTILGI